MLNFREHRLNKAVTLDFIHMRKNINDPTTEKIYVDVKPSRVLYDKTKFIAVVNWSSSKHEGSKPVKIKNKIK